MSEKSKGESIRRKIEKLPATFFIRLQSLSFLIAVVVVVVKFYLTSYFVLLLCIAVAFVVVVLFLLLCRCNHCCCYINLFVHNEKDVLQKSCKKTKRELYSFI